MADSQTNVQVQCTNGQFVNILLDATMTELLNSGQLLITEDVHGQIVVQQKDGQVCPLEYVNQDHVANETTEIQQGTNTFNF